MSSQHLLTVDGQVERPLRLTLEDLAAIGSEFQVPDVSRLVPGRRGAAVTLEGVLTMAAVRPTARYLTLRATTDDFCASIPLDAVRQRAVLIYQLDGQPLPRSAGGPVRLLIPDFAACRTAEIDECANVKFLDHIELQTQRGADNRPHDATEHAELHRRQEPQ